MFLTKTRCQQFKISATISSLTSKHSFTSYRLLYCFTSANAASFFFSQEPSVTLVKCFLGQNMRVRPSGDYFTHTHTHTILWWLQFPLKLGPCSELKRIKYFFLLFSNNFVNSLRKWTRPAKLLAFVLKAQWSLSLTTRLLTLSSSQMLKESRITRKRPF